MIVFHSLVLLISSKDSDLIYTKYFDSVLKSEFEQSQVSYERNLLSNDQSDIEGRFAIIKEKLLPSGETVTTEQIACKSLLPPYFCLDMLMKYELHDYALQFLFYRREFSELLQLIRDQFILTKKKIHKLKA